MLSKRTKYGLKALSFIAQQDSTKPVHIGAIAESENISHKFLENIMLSLRNSGILGSKKGKGGGYYLIKDPSEVLMSEVYRALEGPIAMLPCVSLNYYEKCSDCTDETSCKINRLMIEIRDNTLKILENKSLEDFSNFNC